MGLGLLACGLLVLTGCIGNLGGRPQREEEQYQAGYYPEDSCTTCPNSSESLSVASLSVQAAIPPCSCSDMPTTIPPLRWPTDRGKNVIADWCATWIKNGCDGYPKCHAGIDIGVDPGRPVYAAEDGRVEWVGFHPEWKGWVTIEHSVGGTVFTTVYWHINPSVKKDQVVTRGQQIGTVANMVGAHLHFGVRLGSYSNTSNLGALPRTQDCSDGPKFPEKFVKPQKYANPVNYPPAINNADQYRSNGVTAIREGEAIRENTVVFKATATDPNGGRVKVQIELRQVTEPFTGTPTWESDLVRSGTEVRWTRGGLVDGRYKWRFRAVDEEGLASPWQEFGTAGNTDLMVDRTPPTTPGNLRVTGSTSSRIDLAWNPSTDNLSGVAAYRIYRNGRLLATVPSTQTSFRDTGVKAGERYCYQVSAVDKAGNESARSNEACARAVPWPR